MAVLMILEVPGGTIEQYERTNEILGIAGDEDAPEGLLYHAAACSEEGMVIADVWRSQDDLDRFFTRLGPALAEAGAPEGKPEFHEVHNHLPGKGEKAGVLAILEFDDFSSDDYDAMSASMDAHAAGSHPAVVHTAAVASDGRFVVVDVWESPEAFAAYAQSQIAPAGEDIGLGRLEPRFIPIHNTMSGAGA
jgi:hypothetical protein